MAILLNEARPELYNAHLLDYNAGTVGPNVTYFSSEVSLFFVKFSTKAALRTVTMSFEFVGETEFETVRSISDFTAMLMNSADFKLPDGFCYHCMLTKAAKPNRITDNIYTADFTFVGYRHLPERKIDISKTGQYFIVEGNYEASCVVKFSNQTTASGGFGIYNDSFNDTFTFNPMAINTFTIDGINKKVYDASGANAFSKIGIMNFPRLAPGRNMIAYEGITGLTISYLPIYV